MKHGKCPYCEYEGNKLETLAGAKDFTENDIIFCIKCGEISQFVSGIRIKLDPKNLYDEDIKSEMAKIEHAWLRIQARLYLKDGTKQNPKR